jgi:hypothetical protein
MEENTKVNVVCTVNHSVCINVPSLLFKMDWIGKGSSRKIDKELLEQLLYDPGVQYMFNTGMLYIEEMETKKELGLEPEEAVEPVNIIILNDKQKRNVLINYSMKDFKDMIDKLSIEQVSELAQYAIDNRILDPDRDDYIMAKCGRDIMTAVRLARKNAEA